MRWGKKVLLLFVLIFTSITVTAVDVSITRASGTTVSIDPSTIHDITLTSDEQFSINITVDYVEKLWGYQFWLSFNPDVIHGVSVENGPFLESAGGTVVLAPGAGFDNTEGELKLFGASIFFMGEVPEGLLPTGGGVLATVTFEVVGYGCSPIVLGSHTGLVNQTGGWELGGEWCYGEYWKQYPWGAGGEWVPYEPWLHLLREGSGYFDNRPPVLVNPDEVRGVLPDENFTVSVNVLNMTDVYKWSFCMRWNATLLNVTNVAEGGFLKGQPEGTTFGPPEINNEAGNLTVSCETVGAYEGVSGSGTLANITFLVLDRGECNLTLYDTYLLNSTLGLIYTRTANGYFINLRFHNIAITGVKPYTKPPTAPPSVEWGSGEPIFINVTVKNRGDYPETFNVTAYYDDNEIGRETDVALGIGANVTLAFIWNTSNIDRGKYVVSANATVVEGETETADNIRSAGGQVTILSHDIAITEVSASVTKVYVGYDVIIDVVVENEGTEIEAINVTVYYDGNEIDTKNVTDFGYLASKILTFTWDTTGVELGEHFISANATVVEGETDLTDNTYPKIGDEQILVTVEPLEETFPMELVLIAVIVVIIASAATLLIWWRRRRPPSA